MENNAQQISEINSKIEKLKKKLKFYYTRSIPFSIVVVTAYSFIEPNIPKKSGRKSIIKPLEYSDAVVYNAVLFFIILTVSFYFIIQKQRRKIEKLEREKYVLSKNTKPYKSAESFKDNNQHNL